jgi:hypothetical protein
MSNTRFIIVIAMLTFLVVTVAVSYSIIGAFASNSVSKPERAALPIANEAGMKIYQQSEWADFQRARSSSNMQGLAIYHESEHKSTSVESAVYNEEGLAIYLESERYGAEALPVRLFNGKPFNAYQRSEWLGAER